MFSLVVVKNEKLRRIIKIVVPFAAVPLLVLLGATVFEEKSHIFVSFGVALLSMLLFVSGFEKKKIGSRRAVLTAVMTALCVVGRFIPFFKPITAITVISAIYLGAESGFSVGAMSALVSNFYFGQGPWTPFQMLSWGLIGLFAGYLSKYLKKSKVFLLSYGLVSGVLFSFIMDVWTVLWYNGVFSIKLYLAALATAIPNTVLYAVSNFLFLLLLSKPFGEKLERIKLKYGV